MNEPIHSDGASDGLWPHTDPRIPVPDTSMLPGSESADPAPGLLKSAVQGAHTTIDRLADSAAPAVQKLSERSAAAEAALLAKTDQLRAMRDEWAVSVRTKVRSNPLSAVAAALALGLVIARLTR